jgi:hypothetical protein
MFRNGVIDMVFQRMFDEYVASGAQERACKFEEALYCAEALRQGEISEKEFFEEIMGDGQAIGTFVRVVRSMDDAELVWYERTPDRKVKITREQVGSIPRIDAEIGLNEEGKLVVSKITATYFDGDGAPLGELEGDTITLDFAPQDSTTLATLSKAELGETLLEELRNLTRA